MLYQRLRKRQFSNPEGPQPRFPSDALVTFELIPPWPFGTANSSGLSRTVSSKVLDGRRTGQLHVNKHRGRAWGESSDPLTPLQVDVTIDGIRVALTGTTLVANVHAKNLVELNQTIARIYYWLPVFLNLDFGDPPAIESVKILIKDSTALWTPSIHAGAVFVTDQERQQDFALTAITRTLDNAKEPERRVVAALEYFYAACRLSALGETPGEFLAEMILNFAKILESLFGQVSVQSTAAGQKPGSIDRARAGLRSLGYSEAEIEWSFIPAIVLRNSLGVGHPSTSILSPDRLEVVHEYADHAEAPFRSLLKKILDLPANQRSFLRDPDGDAISSDVDKLLDRLRENYSKNRPEHKATTITSPPSPIAPKSKYRP
jgi:hypothetical protein